MSKQQLHLLMCRASEFGVAYEINPWMDKDHQPNRDKALGQQDKIIQTLQELGHTLEFIESGPDLPDMCFTANAAVAKDGKAFLANLPAERQPEIPLYKTWFESNGYATHQTDYRFGGGGDALWYGDQIIAGFGDKAHRATDIEVHDQLHQYFGVTVTSVHTIDNRFYDLDMAIAILSPSLIAYCPAVLDQDSISKLINLPDVDTFEVSLEDALGFGCNLISDGQNVLISDRAPRLIKDLQTRGFNVLPHPIGQFMLAGGGIRCLSLNLPANPIHP